MRCAFLRRNYPDDFLHRQNWTKTFSLVWECISSHMPRRRRKRTVLSEQDVRRYQEITNSRRTFRWCRIVSILLWGYMGTNALASRCRDLSYGSNSFHTYINQADRIIQHLQRARAKGMALANISDWGFNFLTAFVTPALFEVLKGGFYVLLVSSCVISFVVVYFVYPETAHKSLEELGEVFGEVLPPRRNHKIEEPKVESDTLVQDSESILQADGNNIVEDCRNERREKDHT